MKRLLGSVIVLGVILLVRRSTPAAEIHLDSEIQGIPAKVTNIYTCGHWAIDKDEGFYRIVYIEYFNDCSLMYVQWMRDFTPQNPRTNVLHTLSISEFNANDHISLTFDKPDCVEIEDGIKFTIEATSGHDNSIRHFDLQISHEFGKYTINERKKE